MNTLLRILVPIVMILQTLGSRAAESPLDLEVKEYVGKLADQDVQVRRRAKLMLLRPECIAKLPKFEDQLLTRLGKVESEEDAVLLGYLKLPPVRLKEVLESPHTPDQVRARLGDRQARQRVISRYREAMRLVELHKAAADLLYVNDREALAEFAKRLESSELLTDVQGNRLSVALVLIQVYGQAHPEETLFSPATYLKHANVPPEIFEERAHQDYLRQIERFFRVKHQLEVRLNPPILLETARVGVYRSASKREQ
jgi:hypothetical protein